MTETKPNALTDQETATILAALRFYQNAGQGDPENRQDWIHEIAVSCAEETSLDAVGIDTLCEKINMDCAFYTPAEIVITVEDGLIQNVENIPPGMRVVVHDFDAMGIYPSSEALEAEGREVYIDHESDRPDFAEVIVWEG